MPRSAPASTGKAALGFRAHTGWAVLVALGGPVASPVVVHRSRIELGDSKVPRFVYHEAREAGLAKAPQLVRLAKQVAHEAAERAIGQAIAGLNSDGWRVVAGNVLVGSARVPTALESILASHALIHAAEGELFRSALLAGCVASGLRTGTAPEREIWNQGADVLGLDEGALRKRLDLMGRAAGRPWGMDQKFAALAAWVVLAS